MIRYSNKSFNSKNFKTKRIEIKKLNHLIKSILTKK